MIRLNRDLVERCTVSFFRRGWPTLPDIRLVEVDGQRAVVKDWSRRGWLRRLLQGRFMLRREHGFLRRLEGVDGVPRSYGFPDADSLAIEYFEGRELSEVHPQDYPVDYWDRLESLVTAVHRCGIAHGDLDQEDNIMVLQSGAPAVIDFGGAMSRVPWPFSLWYELLELHDLHCVYRYRHQFRMGPVTATPPPGLADWQKRVLVGFRKMERKELTRTHGRGIKDA